jgi:hypothetical protein
LYVREKDEMRMLPVALGGRRPLRRSLKNSGALSVAWLFMSEYLEKEESVYFLLKYQTTQQMAWRVKEDIDQHKKSFDLSNNFSSFDTYTLSLCLPQGRYASRLVPGDSHLPFLS